MISRKHGSAPSASPLPGEVPLHGHYTEQVVSVVGQPRAARLARAPWAQSEAPPRPVCGRSVSEPPRSLAAASCWPGVPGRLGALQRVCGLRARDGGGQRRQNPGTACPVLPRGWGAGAERQPWGSPPELALGQWVKARPWPRPTRKLACERGLVRQAHAPTDPAQFPALWGSL